MESNFHSTVLQRPPLFDEQQQDGDRRRGRDILNPGSPSASNHRHTQQPALSSTAFTLRSPTQGEFHHPHPQPFPASPPSGASNAANGNHLNPPSRPPVPHHPFMPSSSSGAPSLPPPPLQPPAPATATISASSSSASGAAPSAPPAGTASSSSQLPPRSPLHAPAVYYPHDIRENTRENPKPTSTGSFYDPTTDTTTTTAKRRPSDAGSGSWHSTTQVSTPKVRIYIAAAVARPFPS
jgi:DNA helicase INO80